MPRKVTKSLVRDIQPDRLYNSVQVQRFINRVMLNGHKQIAEKLVYGGMQKAANKLEVQNPLEVFEQAMKNVQPYVETRSRRVGGANYQIPFEVKGQRVFKFSGTIFFRLKNKFGGSSGKVPRVSRSGFISIRK